MNTIICTDFKFLKTIVNSNSRFNPTNRHQTNILTSKKKIKRFYLQKGPYQLKVKFLGEYMKDKKRRFIYN